MPVPKKKFSEGDWFAVPLGQAGFAVGVVARKARSIVLAGYFFGPIYEHVPQLQELEHLKPTDTILAGRFSRLGLEEDSWPIIGKSPKWDRAEWALNSFGYLTPEMKTVTVYEYADIDPGKFIGTRAVPIDEITQLHPDGAMGHIYVQRKLAMLLGVELNEADIIMDRAETFESKFFDDDVAADVRADFAKALRPRNMPTVAAEKVLTIWNDAIGDSDDGPVIYLSLGYLLRMKHVTDHPILDRARSIIENGEGLGRWEVAGKEALADRLAIYAALGEQLNSKGAK